MHTARLCCHDSGHEHIWRRAHLPTVVVSARNSVDQPNYSLLGASVWPVRWSYLLLIKGETIKQNKQTLNVKRGTKGIWSAISVAWSGWIINNLSSVTQILRGCHSDWPQSFSIFSPLESLNTDSAGTLPIDRLEGGPAVCLAAVGLIIVRAQRMFH